MKKRSLFAAIAMLIVSAVVLTSTTYAWFVSNTSASVSMTQANVASAGTGIQVRSHANGKQWTDTLEQADLVTTSEDTNATHGLFTATYNPVSTTNLSAFKKTTIGASNKYTTFADATAGTDYTQYYFDVRTVAAGDRAIATLTVGGNCPATRVLVEVDLGNTGTFSKVGVFSTDVNDWYGIASLPNGDLYDNGANTANYIAANDFEDSSVATTYLKGPHSTVDAHTGLAINLGVVGNATADTYSVVRVTIWVEGNDDQCYASAAAGKNITTSWSLAGKTEAQVTAMSPQPFTTQSPMPFAS